MHTSHARSSPAGPGPGPAILPYTPPLRGSGFPVPATQTQGHTGGQPAGLEVPGLPSPGGGALRPRCAPARVGHLFHWVIILMYRAQRHGFAPPAATDGGGPSSLPAFQWNFPDGRGEARAGHQGPFNEFISQIILPTAQGPQTVGRAWGGAQRQKG